MRGKISRFNNLAQVLCTWWSRYWWDIWPMVWILPRRWICTILVRLSVIFLWIRLWLVGVFRFLGVRFFFRLSLWCLSGCLIFSLLLLWSSGFLGSGNYTHRCSPCVSWCWRTSFFVWCNLRSLCRWSWENFICFFRIIRLLVCFYVVARLSYRIPHLPRCYSTRVPTYFWICLNLFGGLLCFLCWLLSEQSWHFGYYVPVRFSCSCSWDAPSLNLGMIRSSSLFPL